MPTTCWEFPKSGIEPRPQQWSNLLQWQHHVLYLLSRQGTPLVSDLKFFTDGQEMLLSCYSSPKPAWIHAEAITSLVPLPLFPIFVQPCRLSRMPRPLVPRSSGSHTPNTTWRRGVCDGCLLHPRVEGTTGRTLFRDSFPTLSNYPCTSSSSLLFLAGHFHTYPMAEDSKGNTSTLWCS